MSFLLAVLLRGVALSGVGLLAVALLRRASAATRAAVGAVALGAMLALPLGLLVAPKRAVSPPHVSLGRLVFARAAAPMPSTPRASTERAVADAPARASLPVGSIVLAVWSIGAVALVLRTLLGWLVALGWARRASAYTSPGEERDLDVRVSPEIAAPCALWAGRPIVLLLASHVEWTEERRRAVLLHETAHVRRGDWSVLVLSRLVLALHWPDPLVWALARTVRRATEDAADDAVLRAGLAPADYAGHLLDLAPRRAHPGLTLPMASRPDVFRRVQHVLNPHRTRGHVGLAALALGSLLVGGVFVPAACFVAARAQRRSLAPADTSPYADVRAGLTRPGTPENGSVGRFADGTTAKIVQVSMRTPQGIRAWRPSGEPIPEASRREVELMGDHYRSILVRYRKRTAEPEGGLGSGPPTEGGPSVLGFDSSRNQPGPTLGERESVQFIEVPKEDGDRASFTFGLTNEPWRTYTFRNDPDRRPNERVSLAPSVAVPGQATKLRDVLISQGIVHPVLRDDRGFYSKDAKGVPRRGNARATTVSFSIPNDTQDLRHPSRRTSQGWSNGEALLERQRKGRRRFPLPDPLPPEAGRDPRLRDPHPGLPERRVPGRPAQAERPLEAPPRSAEHARAQVADGTRSRRMPSCRRRRSRSAPGDAPDQD